MTENRLATNQPLSAPAQGQPGRLAALGPGGAGRGAAEPTSRSCCRSAMPPATGATSWPTRASRTRRSPAVMNELFVNIKVDREERPGHRRDLHAAPSQLLGEQGGWPLTMFLTPDGEPFWGGTYFPPDGALRPARPSRGAGGASPGSTANERDNDRRERRRAAWQRARRPRAGAAAGLTLDRDRLDQAAARLAAGDRHDPRRHRRARRSFPSRRSSSCSGAPPRAPATPPAATPSCITLDQHVPGRHLRPSRRRLRPLFRRRPLAGAAFREDALRQRPAR